MTGLFMSSQKCLADPEVGTEGSPANKRLYDIVMMARKSWTLKARCCQSRAFASGPTQPASGVHKFTETARDCVGQRATHSSSTKAAGGDCH